MQDIDFDEIDRAVSSVTNSGTPTPVVESPAIAVSAPAPSPAQSPAVRRSSGRFMDVVHASSDMRPVTRSSAPAAASLHREEVADRLEVPQRSVPTAIASSAFHWPETVAPTRPEPVVASPTPAPEPVFVPAPTPVVEEPAAPLESPFLANATIEKRPLGAFSDANADLGLIEDPIPFSGNETAQTEPAPEVSEEVEALIDEPVVSVDPIPAPAEQVELNEEVLLLEEHTEDEPAPAWAAQSTIVETPVATPVEAAAPAAEAPVGPTSITQQYKEQPSTEPQTSGSIYDTEAYHQPLVHAPKKHSGVLVVVWIVSLILVGGGIGAGVYFVLLPML